MDRVDSLHVNGKFNVVRELIPCLYTLPDELAMKYFKPMNLYDTHPMKVASWTIHVPTDNKIFINPI